MKSFRNHAGRHQLPHHDQQLACQGNDHYLADAALGGTARAFAEPQAQRMIRLKPHPAPGQLHDTLAESWVAIFAYALLALAATAGERRAGYDGI